MGAMSGAGITQPSHIRLVDLTASDGLPSEAYKHAVRTLSTSLNRFNMAVIQLPPGDEILLRCVLDSVRMFFHQRPPPGVDSVHADDPADWNRTVGYYAEPHHVRELYDYRPGRSPAEASSGPELPPAGLPELFSTLGTATRSILDAIGSSMDLRSWCFNDLLDNVPLKEGEVSTSVLSSICYGRPGAHHSGGVPLPDQPHMQLFDDHEPHAEKGLLTLMRSDKPGIHVRDGSGRWFLADGDLGPQDMLLFSGLSLYQATAGYLSPALHRTEIGNPHAQMYGRCTVSFKLMPRATAILHCSAMTAADHAVAGPFIGPIVVQDFMQRPHPMDQLVTRPGLPSFQFQAPPESKFLVLLLSKISFMFFFAHAEV
jgi:isopenicillin N synthase-like dioxygenase